METIQKIIVQTQEVIQQALKSGAYVYPPLGVLYLFRHRSLWAPITAVFLPCLLLSIGVIIPMFFFTYLPQAAILTVLNGPLGPVNAAVLVLSESGTIVNAIARIFLLDKALYELFDATLVREGQTELVSKGRELNVGVSNHDGAKKLGKLLMKPFERFSSQHLIQYLILLPLNLVPLVGTPVFLILQGRKLGPSYHARYFQLKEFSDEDRQKFIEANKGAYVAFGTITVVMNMIPFASLLFTFSSTVAAALWAKDIEKKNKEPKSQ